MAGDVDEIGAVGDDLDALGHQTIEGDGADRLLVAGDDARKKITPSPLFSVTCGWSLLAILSAARGSPWLP